MKALILRGKFKGREIAVSQWCNDWFMLDPRKADGLTDDEQVQIMRKPFSPNSLAFSDKDMTAIKKHKNNGILFMLYRAEPKPSLPIPYMWTFIKRRV